MTTATLIAALSLVARGTQFAQTWQGYAHDPQHTAQSSVPSQPLTRIVWQTPVDLQPQFQGDDLHIHYGSPLITSANTVIVPVKTGATQGFELQARSGVDGSLLWTQTTDYILPPSSWTPSFGPTLTPQGRVYWAAAGGTLNYRGSVDVAGAVIPNQVSFYVSRKLKLTDSVQISTPLTSDANGTIFFGYEVNGTAKKKLGASGVARVDMNGRGSFTTLEAGTKHRKVALEVCSELRTGRESRRPNHLHCGPRYFFRCQQSTWISCCARQHELASQSDDRVNGSEKRYASHPF